MRKYSILISLLFIASTYHSIDVDGVNDFSADERIINDSYHDSYWGSQNELKNLFLTWTAETLFIGCEYTLNNNALLIFLDTEDGGISNANGLNWYPRDVQFSGALPDYLIALWNCDLSLGGVRKLNSDGITTTPVSFLGYNSGVPGNENFLEIGIPFSSIGNPEKLMITALICDGDHSPAADGMPDDNSIRGTGSAIINIFREITIDSNGDGLPDDSVKPADIAKNVEFSVSFPSFIKTELSPDIAKEGPVHISVEISDSTSLSILLFDKQGKFIKTIAEVEKTKRFEYNWNISDLSEGIYILKFIAGTKKDIRKMAFVRSK